jgi:predicted transcriptional regulator
MQGGEVTMTEQDLASGVDLDQVVRIVSSYVQNHQIAPDQLPTLIVDVHRALAILGRAAPTQSRPLPAVPIRRSVRQDYVVCLECGFRAQALRRHLRNAHGLEVAQYRAHWNLPADHPITAPAYSNRRSVIAKAIGFGRRRASVTAPSAPPRRRRQRSPPTT